MNSNIKKPDTTDKTALSLYILSDGTGETASAVARAALVQYQQDHVNIIRCQNVRTIQQAESVLNKIHKKKSLLIYTLVLPEIRAIIEETCKKNSIPCVDLLGPLLKNFDANLESHAEKKPGLLRSVDEDYFKRIEATDFSLRHDDGKSINQLKNADIVLVGVSRTSKTPLSIYLSFRGWKVANVPLVLGIPLTKNLMEVDHRRIIGLTIDADNLIRIRINRLKKFGWNFNRGYTDRAHILKEMDYAREIFEKRRWPVVNVTDRALEETAGEVIRIIRARLGISGDEIF